MDWICYLDDDNYAKYEEYLRIAFEKDSITGEAIPQIEKNEFKDWGIKNYMERTNLIENYRI